jgi:hypothetical protein
MIATPSTEKISSEPATVSAGRDRVVVVVAVGAAVVVVEEAAGVVVGANVDDVDS